MVFIQIRELKTRLAGVLHRRALATEAQARFPGTTADPSSVSVTAPLTIIQGHPVVLVQVVLDQSWPAGDDVVRVAAVNGGEGEGCTGLRLEGRGFVAALDAAKRELIVRGGAEEEYSKARDQERVHQTLL